MCSFQEFWQRRLGATQGLIVAVDDFEAMTLSYAMIMGYGRRLVLPKYAFVMLRSANV